MSEMNHQDDLDLLLSLEDRVLETPPGSPSGYLSDDGLPKEMGQGNMSVFRDAVKDCLDYDTTNAECSRKSKPDRSSSDAQIEKFSGLRIQNQVVSRLDLSNHLSDIRFIRLPAIKNLSMGDALTGCWATIGVLVEKGLAKTSSIGKPFVIWKIGCLTDETLSLFLFGDAYNMYCEEKLGTVFALFNCSVRKDKSVAGISLSVFSSKHVLKIGTAADMGTCQGKDKGGTPCSTVINKRQRKYCKVHKHNALKNCTSTRAELKGGNLRTGFRDYLKSEGIYVVKPMENKANTTNSNRPVKLLSVEGLKKALNNADKVTTNANSQGIRFLNHITGKTNPEQTKGNVTLPYQKTADRRFKPSNEPAAKKFKFDHKQRQVSGKQTTKVGVKMIELDFPSSDEEL